MNFFLLQLQRGFDKNDKDSERRVKENTKKQMSELCLRELKIVGRKKKIYKIDLFDQS